MPSQALPIEISTAEAEFATSYLSNGSFSSSADNEFKALKRLFKSLIIWVANEGLMSGKTKVTESLLSLPKRYSNMHLCIWATVINDYKSW